MSDVEEKVARQYGSSDLTSRILAALAEADVDVEKLTAESLYSFDQMHGRQLAATREHVARLNLDSTKRVLDVGSGVGGPARYMASTFGCRVTGIDLTEAFVETAGNLTARCGLSDLVDFQVGSALKMPFPDGRFDVVTCQYVAMNIPDKAGLLGEIGRVLNQGGELMWSSVVASKGEPAYPLPWARESSVSFLVSADVLRSIFDQGGWRIVEWTDETDILTEVFGRGAGSPPPPQYMALRTIISGEDFPERSRNFGRSIQAGSIGSVLVVAERVQDFPTTHVR